MLHISKNFFVYIPVERNWVNVAAYLIDIYTQERYSLVMKKHIDSPKMGEILKEEFMKPYKLSAYKLAQGINVPVSRVQDILHDRRKITVDTSLRLGKYFGVSDSYFLNIQNDIDIRNAKHELEAEIARIQTVALA